MAQLRAVPESGGNQDYHNKSHTRYTVSLPSFELCTCQIQFSNVTVVTPEGIFFEIVELNIEFKFYFLHFFIISSFGEQTYVCVCVYVKSRILSENPQCQPLSTFIFAARNYLSITIRFIK